jgi:hypothetical protein
MNQSFLHLYMKKYIRIINMIELYKELMIKIEK